jgi:RNA polymerase sigma-70 factor (ECF subfamily)
MTSPSADLAAQEGARRVREALARIAEPTDREIIRLRFFEGLSLRQIAGRLGCNHETLRQRYHAVLRRLERELGGLE